jgi:hypothetical protein
MSICGGLARSLRKVVAWMQKKKQLTANITNRAQRDWSAHLTGMSLTDYTQARRNAVL